ncbi:hypothetical protein EI94DRAFT_1754467 [Lactarius quietus]|nr:hypothetical protein EI94DRAFT_1754467 [Lactarius quietus]
MSGYKNFAVIGAGTIGTFIIHQLLTDKTAGTINDVVKALTGVDVVISTLAASALDVQPGIAEVAKEAGVKLFVPSEFGGPTEGATEGSLAQSQDSRTVKAIGIPYALFYTGAFADSLWGPQVPGLDIANGKILLVVTAQRGFRSLPERHRAIRFLCVDALPADQLKNRSFTMAGDTKSFNEIDGKKVEVTYIQISELDARLASNPQDVAAYLQKLWATKERPLGTDNHLYPDWNPSTAVDNIPIASNVQLDV